MGNTSIFDTGTTIQDVSQNVAPEPVSPAGIKESGGTAGEVSQGGATQPATTAPAIETIKEEKPVQATDLYGVTADVSGTGAKTSYLVTAVVNKVSEQAKKTTEAYKADPTAIKLDITTLVNSAHLKDKPAVIAQLQGKTSLDEIYAILAKAYPNPDELLKLYYKDQVTDQALTSLKDRMKVNTTIGNAVSTEDLTQLSAVLGIPIDQIKSMSIDELQRSVEGAKTNEYGKISDLEAQLTMLPKNSPQWKAINEQLSAMKGTRGSSEAEMGKVEVSDKMESFKADADDLDGVQLSDLNDIDYVNKEIKEYLESGGTDRTGLPDYYFDFIDVNKEKFTKSYEDNVSSLSKNFTEGEAIWGEYGGDEILGAFGITKPAGWGVEDQKLFKDQLSKITTADFASKVLNVGLYAKDLQDIERYGTPKEKELLNKIALLMNSKEPMTPALIKRLNELRTDLQTLKSGAEGKQLVKKADSDGDGSLTRSELLTLSQQDPYSFDQLAKTDLGAYLKYGNLTDTLASIQIVNQHKHIFGADNKLSLDEFKQLMKDDEATAKQLILDQKRYGDLFQYSVGHYETALKDYGLENEYVSKYAPTGKPISIEALESIMVDDPNEYKRLLQNLPDKFMPKGYNSSKHVTEVTGKLKEIKDIGKMKDSRMDALFHASANFLNTYKKLGAGDRTRLKDVINGVHHIRNIVEDLNTKMRSALANFNSLKSDKDRLAAAPALKALYSEYTRYEGEMAYYNSKLPTFAW
jgi:hypothetical protein